MNSRKIQNTVAVIIIILAFLALIFQNRIWDWWQERQLLHDSRPVLAEISDLSNNVKVRLPESLTYHRAHSSMALHAKDTVSTDAGSTAVIAFKSGLKVELEPNSLITIEDTSGGSGNLELTFLRGNVKILSQGSGIKLPPAKISRTKLDFAMLEQTPAPTVAPTPLPTPLPRVDLEEKRERKKLVQKKIEEKETLPDSYIASIIRNQRTFLNRCYAQYLRLNPDARGRIDCSLTIEPDGTISTARVIGSTIPDPALQQCVVSTLQRARFKSFKGDPIIVNYPINFE